MGNEFDTFKQYSVQFVYDYYTITVGVETTDDESAIFEAQDILVADLGIGTRDYIDCVVSQFH